MIFDKELKAAYDAAGLSDEARTSVDSMLAGDPVRAVASGRGNVSSIFPSPKNGCRIQAESQTAELALILQMELDPNVLAFVCQPTTLALSHLTQNGKRTGTRHTPDFLVIRRDGRIAFVEVTTRAEAERRASKWPDRFCQDGNGNWQSPAGEEAAAARGLGYEVWVSGPPDVRFSMNARYLWEFYRTEPTEEQEERLPEVRSEVARTQAAYVTDLNKKFGPSVVKYAITRQYVHARLWHDNLAHDNEVCVYSDEVYADACKHMEPSMDRLQPLSITLERGATIKWDGITWVVVNVGNTGYTLSDPNNSLYSLDARDCEDQIRKGWILPVSTKPNEQTCIDLVRKQADAAQTRRANERKEALDRMRSRPARSLNRRERRWLRKWERAFREAQSVDGNGYLGLIDNAPKKGNRTARISDKGREVLEKSIKEDYVRDNAPSVAGAYREYCDRVRNAGVDSVSMESYRKWTKAMDRGKAVSMRSGAKARYQLGPDPLSDESAVGEMAPHGQRAFEAAHIDHTILPVMLISCSTGEYIGTIWLSAMEDAYSRVILAHILTYEKPSRRVVMLLMRECVRRHNRLPQRIIVDGATEFTSTFFLNLLDRYHIEKIPRPGGSPRHGSLIESQFGSTEKAVIRQLRGSTTNLDLDRSLSATHHPANTAIWTADELDELLEQYFYSVFPYERHSGLHDTPANRFDRSIRTVGQANDTFIPYDMNFFVHTLPEIRGETRQVRKGQIRVSHLDYRPVGYSIKNHEGESIRVRGDPYDPSYVYAFVDGEWREFRTTNSMLIELRQSNVRNLSLEIAARAANTGKSYRNPSALLLDFTRTIREKERHLESVKARPDGYPREPKDGGPSVREGTPNESEAREANESEALNLSFVRRSDGEDV